MDRRKFFEQVAAWSAGVCVATPVFNVPAILAAEEKPKGKSAAGRRQGEGLRGPGRAGPEAAGRNRRLRQEGRPRGRQAEHRLGPHAGAGRQHPSRRGQGHRPAVPRRRGQAGAGLRSHLQRRAPHLRQQRHQGGGRVDRRRAAPSACFRTRRSSFPSRSQNAKSIHEFTFYKDALETDCDCYINVPDRQAPRAVQAHAGPEERHGRDRRQPRRNPQGHPPAASPI